MLCGYLSNCRLRQSEDGTQTKKIKLKLKNEISFLLALDYHIFNITDLYYSVSKVSMISQ